MSPRRGLVAAVAPGPYTAWAIARGDETICSTLRRHKLLFLAAWAWFLIHVLRETRDACTG